VLNQSNENERTPTTMRTTRIDVEGDANDRFASFTRKRGSEVIAIEIICSDIQRTSQALLLFLETRLFSTQLLFRKAQ
jgi:hypothetical protein